MLERIKTVLQTKRLQSFGMFFTDCFRCVVRDKVDDEGLAGYCWQVRKDNKVDCKTRANIPNIKFIPANYAELNKAYNIQ